MFAKFMGTTAEVRGWERTLGDDDATQGNLIISRTWEKDWCGSGCLPVGDLFFFLGKHVVKQSSRLDLSSEVPVYLYIKKKNK